MSQDLDSSNWNGAVGSVLEQVEMTIRYQVKMGVICIEGIQETDLNWRCKFGNHQHIFNISVNNAKLY